MAASSPQITDLQAYDRRRIAQPNPQSEWITKQVPAPRIIDQALWDEVKERQKGLRRVRDFHTKRRPRMLLSFLLRCGTCGGGFSKVSEKHYGCSTARNKGTCDNSPGSLRGGKSCRRCSRVQPKPILLHPNMAAHYCKQVADLEQALTAEENRAEATDLLAHSWTGWS